MLGAHNGRREGSRCLSFIDWILGLSDRSGCIEGAVRTSPSKDPQPLLDEVLADFRTFSARRDLGPLMLGHLEMIG